jgi:hypothetical protein
MAQFSVQARGPSSKKYAQLLVEECTNYWMAGRQMCEELSLTGNHCVNRKHQTTLSQEITHDSDEDNADHKKILPTMPHRSSVIFLSACNCGKRQSNRDDPYNLLDANYSFYIEMDHDCCRDLERVPVPIHQEQLEQDDHHDGKLQTLANLVTVDKQTTSIKIECIPYMVTKSCGPNMLPRFPSWALTHIGSSTIYSHSSGVNQPGFISGTRNLHSWDVPLKKIEWKALQLKWPNLAENALKRSNFNPQRKGWYFWSFISALRGNSSQFQRGLV